MNSPRLATAITGINLVLLVFLLAQSVGPVHAQDAAPGAALPILRGSGLEIVDSRGRIRALIGVYPPTTVDGRDYPETVLFRLTDPVSGPVVKLTAAKDGAAFSLSDDTERGGIHLFARDTGSFAKVVARDGREAVLKP